MAMLPPGAGHGVGAVGMVGVAGTVGAPTTAGTAVGTILGGAGMVVGTTHGGARVSDGIPTTAMVHIGFQPMPSGGQ